MAKFAKIIQENNENILIKKFIRLFSSMISSIDIRPQMLDGNSPMDIANIIIDKVR